MKNKKITLSKINNSEWKLSIDINTFFILKQKDGIYYTSQIHKYEPIKEEIKSWLLEVAIPEFYSRKLGTIIPSIDFDYGIITSILRNKKLNELGI